MRRCASDIELVPCYCAGKHQPSRRSTTTGFSIKMAQFSNRFVPIMFQASTNVISRAHSSLRYTTSRRLMPFPCSSYHSHWFSTSVVMWAQYPAKSGVDLHETFKYSWNRQTLQQTRETIHQWVASYHIWARKMYWNGAWTHMNPNYRHVDNFDLPERQKLPSKHHR